MNQPPDKHGPKVVLGVEVTPEMFAAGEGQLEQQGIALDPDSPPIDVGDVFRAMLSARSSTVPLIKREDVVFLITHQRTALLEAAEQDDVKPHHADVLRDMASWWQDLSDAVKKLRDCSTPVSAIEPLAEFQRIFREERVKQSYNRGRGPVPHVPTWTITFTDATVRKLSGATDDTGAKRG